MSHKIASKSKCSGLLKMWRTSSTRKTGWRGSHDLFRQGVFEEFGNVASVTFPRKVGGSLALKIDYRCVHAAFYKFFNQYHSIVKNNVGYQGSSFCVLELRVGSPLP